MGNTAIVLAGGRGNRMKAQVPKQYLEIDGFPLLYYSLKAFNDSKVIDSIVLVTIESDIDFCKKEIVERYSLNKVKKIVSGGAYRYDSVYNGICNASTDGYIFIHDGARPCVTGHVIEALYEDVKSYKAVVAAVPSKDTIKISDADNNVVMTPNRNNLWTVQTPQVFEANLIRRAYETMMNETNHSGITDDAMVIEQYTQTAVHLSMADYSNIKVTTPEDLDVVKELLKKDKKN